MTPRMKLCTKCQQRPRVSSTSAWCYTCIKANKQPTHTIGKKICVVCIAVKSRSVRAAGFISPYGQEICGLHARKFKHSAELMPMREADKILMTA